jgi:hypothetical protein
MSLLIGNVTQPRFHLTGNGLIFDKTLILKVFGLLQEKENGYEEGRTRGANHECNPFPNRLLNEYSPASMMRGFVVIRAVIS